MADNLDTHGLTGGGVAPHADPATAGSYAYMEGRNPSLIATPFNSEHQDYFDAPSMRAAYRAGFDDSSAMHALLMYEEKGETPPSPAIPDAATGARATIETFRQAMRVHLDMSPTDPLSLVGLSVLMWRDAASRGARGLLDEWFLKAVELLDSEAGRRTAAKAGVDLGGNPLPDSKPLELVYWANSFPFHIDDGQKFGTLTIRDPNGELLGRIVNAGGPEWRDPGHEPVDTMAKPALYENGLMEKAAEYVEERFPVMVLQVPGEDSRGFYDGAQVRASFRAGYDFAKRQSPKPIPQPEPAYVIWSNEHCAWWRRGEAGYTPNLAEAGHYPKRRAMTIARSQWMMRGSRGVPNEIAISLPDALDQLGMALPDRS